MKTRSKALTPDELNAALAAMDDLPETMSPAVLLRSAGNIGRTQSQAQRDGLKEAHASRSKDEKAVIGAKISAAMKARDPEAKAAVAATNGKKARENKSVAEKEQWFGKIADALTGRICIHRGTEAKMVTSDSLASYLAEGFVIGRKKKKKQEV